MSTADVLQRLEGVRSFRDRHAAKCPSHEDKRASLSIRELDDGRTLIHCFAGCAPEEILGILGFEFDVLYPDKPLSSDSQKAMKKPWRASDVVRALDFELTVALVLLSDIGAGRAFTEVDRERARVARSRLLNFTQELASAY